MNMLFSASPIFMGILTLLFIILIASFIYQSFSKGNSDTIKKNDSLKFKHLKSIGLLALVIGVLHQLIAWYKIIYEIDQAGDITSQIVLSALRTSIIPLIYGISIFFLSIILWKVSGYVKKNTNVFIAIVITLLSQSGNLSACTIFTYSSDNAVFAGNNEDMCSTSSVVEIIPPSDKAYGRILWGFKNGENYQGGMNEHGLFFDGAGISRVKMTREWKKPKYSGEGDFVMQGALENCKTVEEALEYIQNFKMDYLAYCHILIADETGDAAIVEWGYDQLSIIRKGEENFLIATNFNITETSQVDGECYRYDVAKKIMSNEPPSKESCQKILSLSRQEGNFCTVYSTVCDLKLRKVYLYNFHDFSISHEIDLQEAFNKGRQINVIRDYFPKSFSEQVFRMRKDCISRIDEIPYVNVNFNITLDKPLPFDSIYIRGSSVELGRWDEKGIQLEKLSNKNYYKPIRLKEGALVECEISSGNKGYYPKNKDGLKIKEISFEVKSDTTINLSVFDWQKIE